MEINEKIYRISVFFLIMFGIAMFSLFIFLSNSAMAQVSLHNQTLYEVITQTSELIDSSQIEVGILPYEIGIHEVTGTVYVVNRGSDSVSVISGLNHTKIGEDIPVGDEPAGIAIDSYHGGDIYVANWGSNSVSVISGLNHTKIGEDIPVGDKPMDMAIDVFNDIIYVVNRGSDSVSVISGLNHTKIGEDIPVGDQIQDIAFDPKLNILYVAKFGSEIGSGSVSIINASTLTKIEDIPVGSGPDDITIDPFQEGKIYVAKIASDNLSIITTMPDNTRRVQNVTVGDGPTAISFNAFEYEDPEVYVANFYSDSVSVIDGYYGTKIGEDIPVGDMPVDIISLLYEEDEVYVANALSDTISVISTESHKKIKDIPVGDKPMDIAIGTPESDAVYVANWDSNSVSLIDTTATRVVAGVTFHINPFNSGVILCDELATPSPIGRYVYLYSGTQCVAKPNNGFEFVSWEENLGGNSTQLITVSRPASTWDSFVLAVTDFFGSKSSDEPEATLNVTKFGSFTANFKELPPALPSEYLIPLYGIIITTIIGWSIPSIIGWARSKADVRKLNYYHKRISSLYGDGKLDENDIEPLNRLRSSILDAYSEGKINEKHYQSLRNETSTLYEEIFRNKINLLKNNNNNSSINKTITDEQLAQIKSEVEYAYSKGRIIQKHYDLLTKAISTLDSNEGLRR